jgi:formate dehydrogenase assembly factor FdhD
MAERSGMTLVGFLRAGRFNAYTGRDRIAFDV